MDEFNRPLGKHRRNKAGPLESNSVGPEPTSFGEGNLGIQIAQNYGNITSNLDSSAQSEASENRKCLQALHATDPRLDKRRIEAIKGGLLEDAYNWVLDNAEFKRWCYQQESQLLWIKGDPGKGKTMLLCGIINELIKSASTSQPTVAFFFCQATDARINNATAVLRGLVFMLVDQHPTLISYVRREYDKAGAKVFEDANAWVALLGILTDILRDPLLQTTYLIIDALDECTAGLSRLLDFIVRKSSSYPNVKWLLSSRNWPSIERTFETVSGKETLWLELNEASVSKAVASFIHYKVQILKSKKGFSDDVRDTISRHLLENAQDTFLWVALVCEELAKFNVSKRAVRKKLEEFPAGLDQLYQRMLAQIGDTDDADLCKSILSISTTVYRPITLEELSAYIELPEDVELSDLEEIIGLCGSFLTLRGSTISLVHQSAKDFLRREAVYEIFPHGEEIVHHTIFSKSLDAMTKMLRRDIYGLVHPGYPIDRVENPEPDPLAPVRYACLYWVVHLQICSRQLDIDVSDDFEENGPVDAFFRNHYLHWLEAICLLRGVSEGVASILKLRSLVESKIQNAELIERVKDACRFVLFHQIGIRDWPLQVYASALIFSPVKSITRIQYEAHQPSWITLRPLMEDQWSPCLQTLEGHKDEVWSARFSHDSTVIASASSDHTVKIWDARSGQCTNTFGDHSDMVMSIVFSHDSKLLASVSADSTIKVWDMSNRQCILTVKDHDNDFFSTSFSHDFKFLATGSWDIKLWDVNNGQCLRSLGRHNERVTAVALSPDSRFLASASIDGIIKIWDLSCGECVQTLDDHKIMVTAVTFTNDSHLLASGSVDCSIKLWKTSSWKCLQTLSDHTSWVTSVDFSHDSKLLASGSHDHTVKLWHTTSGQCLQTFKGHRSFTKSVAFSHDSNLIISASSDCTIRVWDFTNRHQSGEFDSHAGRSWLYFSHDSTLLASSAEGDPYDIKIWDSRNGLCIQRLSDRPHAVQSLMFSYDHKLLASYSDVNALRVWDISSGQCMQAFTTYPYQGVREFFKENPELKLFNGTVGLSSFRLEGPNWRTHKATSRSQGYGMSQDERCITWNSECLLWLPPEYRPADRSTPIVSKSRLCISCGSGRVLFFAFDSAALLQALAPAGFASMRS